MTIALPGLDAWQVAQWPLWLLGEVESEWNAQQQAAARQRRRARR